MNILILNWRDIKNPLAGGAEQLTHEIAKGLVKVGHKVIIYSASFPRSKNEEDIDGIKVVRKGNFWNVRFFAFFDYLTSYHKSIDIIIDEVHWFPYFSLFYAPKKTILLACEVAQPLFPILFLPIPAKIFQLLERIYLYFYKRTPTLTISNSTKKDLERYGFSNVTVLPMGVTLPKKLPKCKKEKRPTLIYLARLNKQKGAFDAIEVCRLVKEKIPNIQLWMVGKGEGKISRELEKLVNTFDLVDNVNFFGFVSEEKKFELLCRAHLLIVPSIHEGWGLTIPEAYSAGTFAVAYNVSGLNTVLNYDDKKLTKPNPENIADAILNIFKSKTAVIKIKYSTTWKDTSDFIVLYLTRKIQLIL